MHEALPSFQEILRARAHIARHLHRTPLLHYDRLSELVGTEVWVKHENHHAVGAFKVRGGVHLAAELDAAVRERGLYTASTGNHGQSVAFAGRVSRAAVTVAVPEGANPVKVAAMEALGARVESHGPDFDTAREWIQKRAEAEGARFVGPTDRELIAGVATYAVEILEDQPDIEVLIVPIGAGSGAVGCCLAGKTLRPDLQVIGVQAERAPAVHRSWQAGRRVAAPMETAAEGLATRVAFENTLSLLCDRQRGLDDFVLVSEAAIDDAIRRLLEMTHNVAEGAGAASLAAALELRDRLAGKRVALVLSGGNLDPARLPALFGTA